ncbi:unnamed protein product [Boreogadus saida]
MDDERLVVEGRAFDARKMRAVPLRRWWVKALRWTPLSLHALSPDIAAIAAKRRHYAASSDYIGVVWRRRHREGLHPPPAQRRVKKSAPMIPGVVAHTGAD